MVASGCETSGGLEGMDVVQSRAKWTMLGAVPIASPVEIFLPTFLKTGQNLLVQRPKIIYRH